jgi:hypothetical protein
MMDMGIVEISANEQKDLVKGPTLPRVRYETITEPGNKVRIVTMTEACLSTYLQAYSHVMLELMKVDPHLEAGLGKSYVAYRWY